MAAVLDMPGAEGEAVEERRVLPERGSFDSLADEVMGKGSVGSGGDSEDSSSLIFWIAALAAFLTFPTAVLTFSVTLAAAEVVDERRDRPEESSEDRLSLIF